MKLLSPASCVLSAQRQIESGADELYVGVRSTWGTFVSFSARGNVKRDGSPMVLDLDGLREIGRTCSATGIALNVTMNGLHTAGFLAPDIKPELSFLRAVEEVLACGVDGLIIADLSAIRAVRREHPNVRITASNVVQVNNSESAQFLQDLGVTRIVLPYQITLEEIAAIRNGLGVEVEVFGHYGCSFQDGYCMLKHNVGEAGEGGVDVGTPCRNRYEERGSACADAGAYLDCSLVCGVCAIPALMEQHVDVIKLVGREWNMISNTELTKVYRKAIDIARDRQHTKRSGGFEVPRWWRHSLCAQGRCKYIETSLQASYVGTRLQQTNLDVPHNGVPRQSVTSTTAQLEVRYFLAESFRKALESPARMVAVGQEYCARAVNDPEYVAQKIRTILRVGKQPVLVTSCIYPQEFDAVRDTVIGVIKSYPQIDVVFNDYGLLRTVAAIVRGEKRGTWWLGRLICRTMADWPLFDVIMRAESQEVRERFKWYSIEGEIRSRFHELGIDGVEVNAGAGRQESHQRLRQQGLRIKVHQDWKIVSVSRSCSELRTRGTPSGRAVCTTLCTNCKTLVLSAIEGRNGWEQPSERTKTLYPELMVVGTGVFTRLGVQRARMKDDDGDVMCQYVDK